MTIEAPGVPFKRIESLILRKLSFYGVETLRDFWHSAKRLPQAIDPLPKTLVAGIPVKEQGDFPALWHRDNSFIVAAETLYEQVRTKGAL